MKISCIIPCYNEEKRIGFVLDAALAAELVDEVIVIDNSSEDNTVAEIEKRRCPKLNLIVHEKNEGKAKSTYDGVMKSRGEILLFLDADLKNIKPENVDQLIEPLLKNEFDMVLSERDTVDNKFGGTTFITGERSIRRNDMLKVFEDFKKIEGYAIENSINKYALKNKFRIGKVKWTGVGHTQKIEKSGLIKGLMGEMNMYLSLYKRIGFFEFYRQWFLMKFLVKNIN